MPHRFRYRQHRLLAGERLADDAGEESGGGEVRLARPDANRRRADTDAVAEALAAEVGEQQLADRLLRAVAGERRVEDLVAYCLREKRALAGDGRSEDDTRLVALTDLADRFEKAPCAVEVDAVALLEVGLGLARDDRREVENDVGARGDELLRLARRGKVGDDALRAGGDDVVEDEVVFSAQPLGQLATDHSRGAGDQRPHQFGSQRRHHGTSGRISFPERKRLLGKLVRMTRVVSSRSASMPSASYALAGPKPASSTAGGVW